MKLAEIFRICKSRGFKVDRMAGFVEHPYYIYEEKCRELLFLEDNGNYISVCTDVYLKGDGTFKTHKAKFKKNSIGCGIIGLNEKILNDYISNYFKTKKECLIKQKKNRIKKDFS